MIYSKMLAKFILSALTLSLLAACGGGGDSASSTPSGNNNDDETVIMELSGSVGDGPITGATVTFEGANGNNEDPATSDGNATYQTSLALSESQFPLIIKATGGTDLVTQGAPDFTLYSVVVDPSQERISNINPHSTLITRTAQNLAGGINSANISTAQETVLRLFAFGLDPRVVADPIESQITAVNAANISKSSEILGEMIRRTRDTLIAAGVSVTGDDVVDAIAADLIDGQLDGLGAAQANKRIAAIVSFISGQVLLEAAASRLMVNNAVATSAMDAAIIATRPGATTLTGDVVITAAMLEQIKALANSAASISPLPALSNIINQLATLSGDQLPSEFTRLFPLEVSGAFANIVQQAVQASEADLDSMNRAVNLQTRPDEPGRFEFGAASYSVSENGGVVEITINRVGGNDGAVTVDWMTQGVTATFAQDYGNFYWTQLTFADGETSRTETITIVNDDVVESDETFNVLLGNPTGGTSMGTVTTTVVTITNDDSDPIPQPGHFEFGAASYSVSENDGMIEITINRLGGSDGAVTVDWQTQNDTATSSQDFGGIAQTPLTFADGETSRTETITIINDEAVESDETFNVRLSNPTGGASMGAVTTTAVTIINDDSAPTPQPGRFEFGAASYSVSESGSEVEITINRVGGSDGAATIDWRTVSITATPGGVDYNSFGWRTLTFADGVTSRVEAISIVNDDVVESDEYFNVLLSNPTSGASMGTLTTTAVTITNDDSDPTPQPGRFEFGTASYSVSEDGNAVEITINRVGGSDGAVAIDWMTQGVTATFAQDYGNFNWTPLTFADGETSRTETITIVNDDVVEPDETFNVLLGNPTGGALMGAITTAAVTITNDDSDPTPQPGRFEFSAASYSVSEDGNAVEITINRVGGSDGAVAIDWMTQGVTATFAQDYGNFNWSPLTFADGETSRTETITIVNDDVVEPDETFNVLLGNPTGGALMGAITTTAVTITNDDSDPSPTLSVASTIPLSQAYGIQLSRNIIIEFSDDLDCQNVSSQTISLIDNSGDLPTTLTCADTTLTINPVADFSQSTAYTVIVSSDIASSTGISMADDYSWTFTTLTGSALPLLDEWESKMLAEGERWGEYLTNLQPAPGTYNEQSMTYYDGQRVYYQIADYTGQQEPWSTYAQEAKRIYLNYLENRTNDYYGYNYSIPGYRRFPHGFYMEWLRTGDSGAAISVVKIRDNPAYSNPEQAGKANEWYWSNLSREIAYALNGHVIAEKAGNARNNERIHLYVAMALNHIDEWVTGARANPNVDLHRFAPFMAGLTAEALIDFYEWEVEQGNSPGETIPTALKGLAEFLWTSTVHDGVNQGESMWVADIGGTGYPYNDQGGTGYGAFRYEDRQNPISAIDGTDLLSPELNMLIAPLYAWLFNHYADVTYIERGDLIWEGGVALSNVGWNTKIFNQNYRWSFDYIKWRNEGFAKIGG